MSYTNFWRSIRSIITPGRLSATIDLVRAAMNMQLSNQDKRAWVITELLKVPGMNENVARLLVEMAVNYVKEEHV